MSDQLPLLTSYPAGYTGIGETINQQPQSFDDDAIGDVAVLVGVERERTLNPATCGFTGLLSDGVDTWTGLFGHHVILFNDGYVSLSSLLRTPT